MLIFFQLSPISGKQTTYIRRLQRLLLTVSFIKHKQVVDGSWLFIGAKKKESWPKKVWNLYSKLHFGYHEQAILQNAVWNNSQQLQLQMYSACNFLDTLYKSSLNGYKQNMYTSYENFYFYSVDVAKSTTTKTTKQTNKQKKKRFCPKYAHLLHNTIAVCP